MTLKHFPCPICHRPIMVVDNEEMMGRIITAHAESHTITRILTFIEDVLVQEMKRAEK